MASDTPAQADHLAVLVHGLWGHPKHLNHVRDTLRDEYPADRLHILVATSIADNKTYDGIEVGGERVANEIEEKIAELEEKGSTIRKISITGYSLGGLIARYAIGLLYSSGLFDRVQPVNVAFFASPHIGVRYPRSGYRSFLFNILGAKTLSTSGQQMFLVDKFRDSDRPLLSLMTDPSSVFIRGLSRFKHRALYANTINDRSVPYHTAAMSRTNPFAELDKVEVHYLEEQPSPGQVLLDPGRPATPKRSHWEDMTTLEYLKAAPRSTLKNLPIYIFFSILLPIALPVFVLNAGYQTYRSAQRIRLHESGQAFKLDRYRMKLLEEVESVQDRVYGRLAGQSQEEYLPTPPPERDCPNEPVRDDIILSRRESAREKSHDFPILALTEEQFDMIDSLDKVSFIKYPVHIQKVRHTHAAIIVRMQRESFAEGKVVVKHWAESMEV